MQITLETKPFATLETDALVSYVFEDAEPVQGRIAELDQFTDGLLRKLASGGELTGKTLEMTLVHAPRGLKVPWRRSAGKPCTFCRSGSLSPRNVLHQNLNGGSLVIFSGRKSSNGSR